MQKGYIKRKIGQDGNAALELLLFLPLALFFLFIVTDAGVAIAERAAVSDAVRTVLQQRCGVQSAAGDNQTVIDREKLQHFVDSIAGELEQKIKETKHVFSSSKGPQFGIEVRALELLFDRKGQIKAAKVDSPLAAAQTPLLGVAEPSANSGSYPYVPRDKFISTKLEISSGQGASIFSVPLGIVYNAEDPSVSHLAYMSRAVALYVEVRTVANGINQDYVKGVLGQGFALQLQHFDLLRRNIF